MFVLTTKKYFDSKIKLELAYFYHIQHFHLLIMMFCRFAYQPQYVLLRKRKVRRGNHCRGKLG